jgi:hypothetical protein
MVELTKLPEHLESKFPEELQLFRKWYFQTR